MERNDETGMIKFKTFANPARTRKNGSCVGRIIHNECIGLNAMAHELSEWAKLDESTARYYICLVRDMIIRNLAEGNLLDFDAFALSLTLKGAFSASNSTFDPKRNSISAILREGKALRDALKALKPVNTTFEDDIAIRVKRLAGVETKTEGSFRIGEKVIVTGIGLVTAPDQPDEGVALEDINGKMIVRGKVLESHLTRLDCIFDAADVKPEYRDFSGKCRFVLLSRSGSPDVIPRRATLTMEVRS